MNPKAKQQSVPRRAQQPKAARFPMAIERLAGAAAAYASPRTVLRPQRPLREAEQERAAAASDARVTSGLGLDSAAVRLQMVRQLRELGGFSEAALHALQRVPRHQFVDPALANQAYRDMSLPIGHGQTISKPSVVARMIDLLLAGASASRRQNLGRTLEVGTGCGYQAALLCLLATQVISIERVQALFERAQTNLRGLRAGRLRLVHGDGRAGHAPNAPYDSIIAAACGADIAHAWLDQLAVGGRLVAPVGRPVVGTGAHSGHVGQALVVIDRHAGGLTRSEHDAVLFVPLKSGLA
jgi:protein-L-isoaspartate(D-aspartate) O-methyltransferase